MIPGKQGPSPFEDLIDTVKTLAHARGADRPDWNDVWLSLLQTSDYAKALAGRGISPGSLHTEIDFISRFAPNLNAELSNIPSTEEIKAAIEELKAEIEPSVKISEEYPDDVHLSAAIDFDRVFKEKLNALERAYPETEEEEKKKESTQRT